MATKQEMLDAIAGMDDDEEVKFLFEEEEVVYDLFDSGHKDGQFYIYLREEA